ncbi:YggU family protein [Allofrancisella guangzhouensis]|uniref:UPF0235 protein SD28_01455 n=1 Tax=Allofrancisella guangzhouensis TaxID=594679 RepID=A0A0A8E2H9_9GAMM|nr:DUF167 domain-containing protein [Allofrancisella guangzhouensis]AJC48415.1 hypothetical protein SD28_01455 [Allofrancisella guangzhouensis]MBK2027306.1 YggU family protein [Allofrancisella guangzhouensis]MBK2043538.1 YggU family protein [Allofrancisella guangzhouensis]MBK2045470.1 YggU family protein [Allofrancisella guangzhouensis]
MYKVSVYIQPNSSKTEICREYKSSLKIKISSPAVDGKANKAVIDFLSKQFKIKKKNIIIVKGITSRQKVIALNVDKIPDLLEGYLNLS